jgi:hypothetical protein
VLVGICCQSVYACGNHGIAVWWIQILQGDYEMTRKFDMFKELYMTKCEALEEF